VWKPSTPGYNLESYEDPRPRRAARASATRRAERCPRRAERCQQPAPRRAIRRPGRDSRRSRRTRPHSRSDIPGRISFRRTRPHSRPGPIEGRSRGRRRLATRRTASTTSRMASVHTTRGRVQNGDVYEEQDGAYDEQSATTTSTTSRTEQNGVHDNQYSVRDEQNGIHEQNGVHDEQDRTLTSLPRRVSTRT
jgi:hypothetical protein